MDQEVVKKEHYNEYKDYQVTVKKTFESDISTSFKKIYNTESNMKRLEDMIKKNKDDLA